MTTLVDHVKNRNLRVVKLMVALPGSVSEKELNYAFLYAASQGFSECVEVLLNNVPDLDLTASNSSGFTALMQAAENGRTAVVDLLIAAGCPLNVRSKSGSTALHLAAKYGNVECVDRLLKGDANVNALDNEGDTPLLAAAKRCRYTLAVLERLVEEPACRVNQQNVAGRTALHHVVNQADMITWCCALLSAGADPDVQDAEGNTPFMLASTEGFDEILKCLLEFRCNPNLSNVYKKSPIHFLAQKNHFDVINCIAKLHGDVNPVDGAGNLPIYYAVKYNRPEAVKALLQANCKLEPPPDSGGGNPLATALELKHWDIGKLLVLAGCNVSPLYPWLAQLRAEEAEERRRSEERSTLFADQMEDVEEEEDGEDARRSAAVEWFSEWLHKPHSLQQLCRISVRRHLGKGCLIKGSELPVPQAIIDYITLKEVHDHHIEGYLWPPLYW